MLRPARSVGHAVGGKHGDEQHPVTVDDVVGVVVAEGQAAVERPRGGRIHIDAERDLITRYQDLSGSEIGRAE